NGINPADRRRVIHCGCATGVLLPADRTRGSGVGGGARRELCRVHARGAAHAAGVARARARQRRAAGLEEWTGGGGVLLVVCTRVGGVCRYAEHSVVLRGPGGITSIKLARGRAT